MAGLASSCRERVPERMDDPGLPADEHAAALAGLARLHRASGTARSLWRPVAELARREGLARLSLLDAASGGGDLPLALWRAGRRVGLELSVLGVDRSPVAVARARALADAASAPLRFAEHDLLAGPPPESADVVTCSLFLHHLADGEAELLLEHLRAATRRLLLVLDLSRGSAGLLLAWLGGRLLTRSAVVHGDGPASVRAAFTPAEAAGLAARAGLRGARVQRRFPCRWLLRWTPDDAPLPRGDGGA